MTSFQPLPPLSQKRAYSHEQKDQRRTDILSAAARLFESRRYEAVTMQDVARQAGVSKGTVYVYFRSKEALFLVYAKQEIDQFFDHLYKQLSISDEVLGVKGVVKALGQSYARSRTLIRLRALLHRVLESNVVIETVLEFRRSLLPQLKQIGDECERHLWFLTPGSGPQLLLSIHCIALGFQQLAEPTEILQSLEHQPDMEIYRFDFATAFLQAVDALLAGMEVRARQQQ